MPATAEGFKSAETVLDSSSDGESLPSLTLARVSPSGSGRSSPFPSESPSSPSLSRSSTPSPSRSPSPDPSSYQYVPPGTYILSTSKNKPALPSLRPNEEMMLVRIPMGVSLSNMQFNLRKRKVRIGEEEWKLLDLETNDVRIIQPKENSERFEFGVKRFSMGLNVVRDVKIPGVEETVHEERVEAVESPKKKRKREDGEPEVKTPKKHKEKKHREEKHDKRKDNHHKEKDKKKDNVREEERKEKHKHKDRHDKREKHRH